MPAFAWSRLLAQTEIGTGKEEGPDALLFGFLMAAGKQGQARAVVGVSTVREGRVVETGLDFKSQYPASCSAPASNNAGTQAESPMLLGLQLPYL